MKEVNIDLLDEVGIDPIDKSLKKRLSEGGELTSVCSEDQEKNNDPESFRLTFKGYEGKDSKSIQMFDSEFKNSSESPMLSNNSNKNSIRLRISLKKDDPEN